MKYYCATQKRDKKWTVGIIGPCNSITPIGCVRDFTSFDEANEVAKDIADGKYSWLANPGRFVSMR